MHFADTRDRLNNSGARFEFEVGDFTYGYPDVRSYDEGTRLTIGKFCSISDNVKIFLGGNHRSDWVTTYPFTAFRSILPGVAPIVGHPSSNGDVTIGNDVWLASHCTILSGVTIGDGAVVGAHALVTKNVPPYALVGGNPAAILGYRFSRDDVEKLLEAKWWDLSIGRIIELTTYLLSGDIDALIEKVAVARHIEQEEMLAKARDELSRLEVEIAAIKSKIGNGNLDGGAVALKTTEELNLQAAE